MEDSLAFNQMKLEDRQCIAGVDLSQSLNRAPATHVFSSGSKKRKQVVVPTILPNSLIWLMFPLDGVVSADGDPPSSHANLPEEPPLTGVEQMCLRGWPTHDTNLVNVQHHHSVLRDLSGNMFTGTVFLSMMLALLFSVEWSNLATDAADDAADNAADDAAIEAAVTHAVKRRRT